MIRTRIAPSPTGYLHIGTARTALFNYLFTKKNGGEFILRLDDTDLERSNKKFERDIKENLKWLGIDWDKEHKQSEHFDLYKKYAQHLLDEGKAYEEDGPKGDKKAVILKNSGELVSFTDLIRGELSFKGDTLADDLVLIKSDGSPAYHFASVVDDIEMEISHVIRGEDHIPNTPKQILMFRALGLKPPQFAHLPLILGPDRAKLSKRHGAVSINEYKRNYLPEALVNFMALIGWNPGGEKEIFSMDELIAEFSLERVHKGGAAFGQDKLDWINQEYIKALSAEEFIKALGGGMSESEAQLVQPYIKKLSDAKKEIEKIKEKPNYKTESLIWKDAGTNKTRKNLEALLGLIDSIKDNNFTVEVLEEALMPLAKKEGKGEVLWPMRFALSGKNRSPGPFELAAALGKKETIERLNAAIEKLS